ncbi:hypothetical protein CL628_01755 [bacterium]|nr:hypothetical protein [bacterium]|tara:strand:- start:561 stop:1295 length:735 start_codon:yes stop_codon:yes gene_type:complete
MKKWLRSVLIGIGVLVVISIVLNVIGRPGSSIPADAGAFITANPFDLSQIRSISAFRSCEGHNFSGDNALGEEETYRTMKHYVEAIGSLADTEQRVKIFAPFTGRISQIGKDRRGSQAYVSPESGGEGWDVIFFHIDLLPQFAKRGAEFSSGEHLGYANLIDAANFDISLRNFGIGRQLNDSPFLYMTDDVLAQYAGVGITLDNMIISKEARNAAPCQLAPGESGRDAFYARSEAGKSWITVQQ